jgi:hypothetical protein
LRFVAIQPVILTSRRIRWGGSELWSLFKYSRSKFKNQKPIAIDVLFQAYPMVPLLWRFNLAGRYLPLKYKITNLGPNIKNINLIS